jgi:hypothetical protein
LSWICSTGQRGCRGVEGRAGRRVRTNSDSRRCIARIRMGTRSGRKVGANEKRFLTSLTLAQSLLSRLGLEGRVQEEKSLQGGLCGRLRSSRRSRAGRSGFFSTRFSLSKALFRGSRQKEREEQVHVLQSAQTTRKIEGNRQKHTNLPSLHLFSRPHEVELS